MYTEELTGGRRSLYEIWQQMREGREYRNSEARRTAQALEPEEARERVTALMKEILLRKPVPLKLEELAEPLARGRLSEADFVRELVVGDEYQRLTKRQAIPEAEARRLVNGLYKLVLRRPADAGGLDHYVGRLTGGEFCGWEIWRDLRNSEEAQSLRARTP
jgi:hypothetical protein